MLPSLNSLRAFEAVARHQSFTVAARELAVTQSAVSHQVRNLEDQLGVRLLQRHPTSVSLTSQGDTLFRGLSEAFGLIQRSVADVRSTAADAAIGVSLRSHFAARWLAPRMAALWERHPGLNIRFLHSNEAADFSQEHIHLSIEWCHFGAVPKHAALIKPGNLTPAIDPRRLETVRPLIRPHDLAHHTLLCETNDESWPEWFAAAGVANIEPARRIVYEDTNVRHHATIAGEGVSLVCPELVRDDIAAGRLVCPFDIHLDSFAYYLVVPPSRLANKAVRSVQAWLLREAQAELPTT